MHPVEAATSHDPQLTPPAAGLSFHVCRSLADVEDAWSLVYRSYLRAGLIRPNPTGLHLVRQAVTNEAVVIRGRIGGVTVSTISAYVDGQHGLPLDSVYRAELDALRLQGRRLIEIGLFADRRSGHDRCIAALLQLMSWACHFGVHRGALDGVVGVHPRHAAFYRRSLGFEAIGDERSYSLVNDRPVVLLHLDWRRQTGSAAAPRGLRHLADHPHDAADYAERWSCAGEPPPGSRVRAFLDLSREPQPA